MVDELAARGVTAFIWKSSKATTTPSALYKRSGFRSIGALPTITDRELMDYTDVQRLTRRRCSMNDDRS